MSIFQKIITKRLVKWSTNVLCQVADFRKLQLIQKLCSQWCKYQNCKITSAFFLSDSQLYQIIAAFQNFNTCLKKIQNLLLQAKEFFDIQFLPRNTQEKDVLIRTLSRMQSSIQNQTSLWDAANKDVDQSRSSSLEKTLLCLSVLRSAICRSNYCAHAPFEFSQIGCHGWEFYWFNWWSH